MTGVRFADVQGRPAEFLNLTSLTLEEFEALVAHFEAAFQGRRGASMGNPEPLHRLSNLPAGNAGRSAVLPAHLPEDLHRSSGPGAAVRHEPEQSQPVVLLPALLAALRGLGDAPARSLTAPAGCLGGSAGTAGGACALPSLRGAVRSRYWRDATGANPVPFCQIGQAPDCEPGPGTMRGRTRSTS
jgi:hypothetical protein